MKKYAIGLYEKAMPPTLSWREKLTFARDAGYDFVEISIDEKGVFVELSIVGTIFGCIIP